MATNNGSSLLKTKFILKQQFSAESYQDFNFQSSIFNSLQVFAPFTPPFLTVLMK